MSDFSVFATQAHVEKIEHALAEVLLSDATLHDFFDGRIVVTPEPFMFPDIPVPLLAISAIQEGDVFQLNSEREITLPVALGCFYDELRETVEPADRTVKSLIQHLKVVILANRLLQQTSISQNALVDRVVGFDAVPFPPIAQGADGNAIFNFQLVVTFQYGVDVATGVP